MAVIISSDQTSVVQATATDSYFLKQGVILDVPGYGILGSASNTGSYYQIDGTIHAFYCAIYLSAQIGSSSGNEVRFGKTAQVLSETSYAIILAGGDNIVVNEGVVRARVGGAFDLSEGDKLDNSGLIVGDLYGISSSNGGLSLKNSGTIESIAETLVETGQATLSLGSVASLIENSGFIVANGGRTIFSNGAVELYNSGLLASYASAGVAFEGAHEGNELFNSGRIIGDVLFTAGSNSFAMDAGSVDGDITSTATSGADTFQISGGTIRGYVDLSGGNDTLILRGGIVGDGDSDGFITGGAGDDTYRVSARVGSLVEADDGGTDTVRASISFTLGAFFDNLSLTGDDDLSGYGNGLANTITGNAGDNVLKGRGGADTVHGGAGADILDGGADTDLATYAASSAGVTVSLATGRGKGGDADGDRLLSIENLTGSDVADVLTGSKNANVLAGLDGDDKLRGGKGDDLFQFANGGGRDTVLDFQQGRDLLQLSGWGSVDAVFADLKPLMRQRGKDVIIDLDSLEAGDAIVLKNTQLREMSAADFFVI